MNQLLRSLKSLATASSDRNREVFNKLNELRDSGGRVSLTVAGDSNTYTCRVSASNAKHKVFVVNDFSPAIPSQFMTKAKSITVITAIQDRQSIALRCQYLEPLVEKLNAGHQLKFCNIQPEILHNSRAYSILPPDPVK